MKRSIIFIFLSIICANISVGGFLSGAFGKIMTSQAEHQSSDNIVNQYQVDRPYGFDIVTEYANGVSFVVSMGPCSMCGGTGKCFGCNGRGAQYRNGIVYPCAACMGTGKCMCYNDGGYVVITSQAYEANGNPIFSPIGNIGGYSGSSSNSSSDDRSYITQDCPTCHGTGTCQGCYGDGIADSPYTGGNIICPNCTNNRGKCSVCNGTGKRR